MHQRIRYAACIERAETRVETFDESIDDVRVRLRRVRAACARTCFRSPSSAQVRASRASRARAIRPRAQTRRVAGRRACRASRCAVRALRRTGLRPGCSASRGARVRDRPGAGRARPAPSASINAPSWRKKCGNGFEPRRFVGERQAPQARQIPGFHLNGRCREREAMLREHGARPIEVCRRTADLCIGVAQRLFVEHLVARRAVDPRCDLRQIRDAAAAHARCAASAAAAGSSRRSRIVRAPHSRAFRPPATTVPATAPAAICRSRCRLRRRARVPPSVRWDRTCLQSHDRRARRPLSTSSVSNCCCSIP